MAIGPCWAEQKKDTCHGPPRLRVPGLGNGRRRASDIDKKLPELHVNMLVAAIHQKLNVLNHLYNGSAFVERLRRHPRAVAVVDAVVTPLEYRAESFLKLVDRGFPRFMLVGVGHRHVVCPRDAEEADFCVWPGHPGVERVTE